MYGAEDIMGMSTDYLSSAATGSSEMLAQTNSILGALAIFGSTVIIVGLVISVFTIIANWKIFTKAGQKGWKSLIPIYNTVTLFKIAGVTPLLLLGYFAAIIPVVGILACLGITIYVYHKLAKAFGKDAGFTVGLVLLNTIFMMILGFGKSEYQLNTTTTENK